MSKTFVAPKWVITHDYEEEPLGILCSGKEAGCFLVRRSAAGRWCLLVRKDYRKRADRTYKEPVRPGERGIRRDAYLFGVRIVDKRERKAAEKKTAFGKAVVERTWTAHEFEMLQRLWRAGVRVPYPAQREEHAFYMQFVGRIGAPAPRLADAHIEEEALPALLDDLVENLRLMAAAGVAHADLSAFNILLFDDKAWIIDVPQAVDMAVHPNGFELFERDVRNIATWFARQGLHIDADALTRDLLSEFR